ncbi:ABC transporter ATP-binding protein [Isoptericola sp. NPDC019693]|uniref:ABC transporter ATP-binding protein n=1 Tax=Isoptericola sp. NPDC019693 TaxID=3364009 RepID=UPI0037A52D09
MTTRHATAGVTASGLTKRFGSTVAVDEIDLSVTGGVVGLLGPNGAGKTTVLRMLATVLAPDAGRLDVLGHDPAVASERLEIRRRLGYLPQSPDLYQSFTAFELVDYVAVLKEHADRRWRHRECLRVLELVGLGDRKHAKIRSLSGGLRQRVALAAALVGSPDLLVLDEPAGGLDPEQRLELRSLLAATATRGTVVVSTHNTAEVAALCDTVVILVDGTVRFHGSPDGLRDLAAGRVWESDQPAADGARSWATPHGAYRHLGTLPAGVSPAAATLEDGYLLAVRDPS